MKLWHFGLLTFLATTCAGEWISIGPDGGYVQALAIDPNNSSRLLAITYSYPDTPQVYVSTDSGAHWQVIGRFDNIAASALAFDPYQTDRVYALGSSGWILISTDCGATWRIGSLPGLNYTMKPDPHTPGRILVGGYDVVNGNYLPVVFISTDYGENWTRVVPDSAAVNRQILCLAFDPSAPDVVWVGGSGARVYRSEDGGVTWEMRACGLPENSSVQMLAVNPRNSNLLLAATSAGAYRTTDGGEDWQQVDVPQTRVVDFPLTDAARGYAVGYDETTRTGRVFVSTDSGANWTLAQPGFVLDKAGGFCSDPNTPDVAFINNNRGVFRTGDGGNHWSERHYGMRFAHISTISVNPVESSRVYLEFYENGVYKSTDGGNTWQRCEDFLACGNICGIGVAPGSGADVLYALEGKG